MSGLGVLPDDNERTGLLPQFIANAAVISCIATILRVASYEAVQLSVFRNRRPGLASAPTRRSSLSQERMARRATCAPGSWIWQASATQMR